MADTSTVLHLVEIDRPDLLCLFQTVTVSQHVRSELRRQRALQPAARALAGKLKVKGITFEQLRQAEERVSGFKLQEADVSTAALAEAVRPDVVLTDDLALRKALESQGWIAVGSVGVLIRAFRTGLLSQEELPDILGRLLDNSSLYTSEAFRAHVRDLLNEEAS